MVSKVTIHGYLPNGVAVEFSNDGDNYEWALQLSNQLIAAGMLIAPPSIEGEQHETIGYAVRMEKISSRDGFPVPMIDLYYNHPDVQHKLLSIYLNTPEQVNEFEVATGLKIDRMPLWEGGHIERGANPRQDQYVVSVPRLPRIVWKENPKYNPDEPDAKKRKPKRLFVRWETTSLQSQSISWDRDFVNAQTIHLFDHENHQANAIDRMIAQGIITDVMGDDEVIDVIVSNREQRQAEKQTQQAAKNVPQSNDKGSNSSVDNSSAQSDLEWVKDAKAVGAFKGKALKMLELNQEQVVHALRWVSGDYTIKNVTDFRGSKQEAWAACVVVSCNYESEKVKALIPDENNATRQLALEMMDRIDIPF